MLLRPYTEFKKRLAVVELPARHPSGKSPRHRCDRINWKKFTHPLQIFELRVQSRYTNDSGVGATFTSQPVQGPPSPTWNAPRSGGSHGIDRSTSPEIRHLRTHPVGRPAGPSRRTTRRAHAALAAGRPRRSVADSSD